MLPPLALARGRSLNPRRPNHASCCCCSQQHCVPHPSRVLGALRHQQLVPVQGAQAVPGVDAGLSVVPPCGNPCCSFHYDFVIETKTTSVCSVLKVAELVLNLYFV